MAEAGALRVRPAAPDSAADPGTDLAAAPPAVETPHASKPAKVTAGSAGKTAGSGSKKPAKRLAEGGSQGGGAKRKRLRPHSDAAAPGSRPAAAAPPQQGEQPKHGAAGSRGSKLTPMHRLLQRDLLAKFGGGPLPRELAVYFDPQKPLPVVPLVLQLQRARVLPKPWPPEEEGGH